MAGEPKLGPHPLWDQHQHPIAEHTISTIGIFESDLIKIKISFWPRGHYNQLICVGQQARRGSDDLRVIWHNSNTYYIHIQLIAVKTNWKTWKPILNVAFQYNLNPKVKFVEPCNPEDIKEQHMTEIAQLATGGHRGNTSSLLYSSRELKMEEPLS